MMRVRTELNPKLDRMNVLRKTSPDYKVLQISESKNGYFEKDVCRTILEIHLTES